MSDRRHVAVVGGGFAGLAAAVRLAGAGARVTLLERRPFLGGRAYSFTDPVTGDVVDNGPHAFMGAYVETIDFLREIGAADRLVFGARLAVALADPARGCARVAAPPLPGPLQAPAALLRYAHLSSADRARLLLGALRLARRPVARLRAETVAQALAAAGQGAAARFAFWDPLVIATMNEVPEAAAAAPFVAVVRQGFLSGARAARFALASVPLSELYVPDATRAIAAAGGMVRSGVRVAEIVCREDRVVGVRLQDGEAIAADAVILAVPLSALWRVVPAALAGAPPLRALADVDTSPIVSVHCWLDRAVGWGSPFLGLLGCKTHWLFDLGPSRSTGHRLASVSSGARFWEGASDEEIAAQVLADVCACLPGAREARLLRHLVVRERHATLSLTPAADAARPSTETPLRNLFLAGDWIQTGLPATIESAVIAGRRAADLALRPSRAAGAYAPVDTITPGP